MNLNKLRDDLRIFADERDWNQFHSPKNLSMALIAEVAELIEHFQWVSEKDSYILDEQKRIDVSDEIADILLYLVRLSDQLNIDPLEAAFKKIKKNAVKYPVLQAKGNNKKYTEFDEK